DKSPIGGRVVQSLKHSLRLLSIAAISVSLMPDQTALADSKANKKAEATPKADYILTDAKIYTADSGHHMAEALAVRDGKIIFVGSTAEAAKFTSKKTIIQKAGGKLVLPGLIDAHMHPTGIVDFGGCDLKSQARTLAQIAEFVRGCVEKQKPEPGQWV